MKQLIVESARDLGPQFTANPHRMVGQDGAYSVPLGSQTALWFFGDTLIGARVAGESLWFPGGERLGPGDMSGHGSIEKLLTNTALILEQSSGADGLTNFRYVTDGAGQLKQLVARLSDESSDDIRVWCFHGYRAGDRLYLFYQTVRMLADGPMPVNFEIIGSGLAHGDAETFEFERIDSAGKTIWWDCSQPQFGCAVLAGNDDWLYIYGVMKDTSGTQQCYMARVRPQDIAAHEKYEYLRDDSPAWSDEVSDARSIMAHMPNEMSVSWNAHLGCYLAVHSFDLSGRIVSRTAQHPWGPWSDPVDLWQVTVPAYDYHVPYVPLIYAGKEHPELSGDKGRVLYITYIEFEEYFPHLVEVTLA